MTSWHELLSEQGDPPPDCVHGLKPPQSCDLCENVRLRKLLAQEETESAEMQALLFQIVALLSQIVGPGAYGPSAYTLTIPALTEASLRVWCAKYGYVLPGQEPAEDRTRSQEDLGAEI